MTRATGRISQKTLAGAALVLLSISASGCVTLPVERATTESTWTPATTESLQTWLDNYDKVNNRANKELDKQLVATIDTGLLQHASKAEYTLAEKRGEADQLAQPYTHEDAEFFLPPFDNYPLWGFVSSVHSETNREVLDLATRPHAGQDWRKLLSVPLDDGVQVPELAKVNGNAVDVPLNEPGNLRRSAAQVGRAFGGLLLAAETGSPFAIFTDHPLVVGQIEENGRHDAAERAGQASVEHSANPVAMRALETKDGGALLIVGLREQLNIEINEDASLTLGEGSPLAEYSGKTTVTKALQAKFIWQVAMVIPPKGPKPIDSELLGVRRTLTSATVE